MKKLKILCSVLALFFAVAVSAQTTKQAKSKTSEVTFGVTMDCKGCASKVQKNIPYEKGVEDLKVDFDKQTVWIKYRNDKTNVDNLKGALDKLKIPITKTDAK